MFGNRGKKKKRKNNNNSIKSVDSHIRGREAKQPHKEGKERGIRNSKGNQKID